MLPDNNEDNLSLQTRKLNLEAKYESLVILPEETTEKSCVPPCDNCICTSNLENNDDVPPLEEDHSSPLKEDENITEKEFESENNEQLEEKEEEEEQLKEKDVKKNNLEESIIDKELKNQKECIIV